MKTIVLVLAFLALCSATKQAAVVANYVEDIIEGITAEQLSHEQLYNDSMDQCDDEFAYRLQAISDGNDALNRAQAHHDRCALNQADAEADLAQVQQNIAQIDATTAKLTTRRSAGRAQYTKVAAQLTEAITAIEGCFSFIDSMEDNASFVQVSKSMMGAFKQVAATGYGSSMAGVLTAMVELTQSYDAGKVAEVRRLFNQLLEELRDSRSMAVENEERAQSIFETSMTEYAAIKGTLKTQEAELSDYQITNENCVDQESFVIQASQAKVDNNESLLQYAQAMCTAFSNEFDTATSARKNELRLLNQIREYVIDRKDEFDGSGLGLEISGAFEEYAANYEAGEAAVQTPEEVNAMLLQMTQNLQTKKTTRNLRRK